MRFSLFLFGLVFGSLIVAALTQEFTIPIRSYHVALCLLAGFGWLLAILGR